MLRISVLWETIKYFWKFLLSVLDQSMKCKSLANIYFWVVIKNFKGFCLMVKIQKHSKFLFLCGYKNILVFFIDCPRSLRFPLLTRLVIGFCFNPLDFYCCKWWFIPLVVISVTCTFQSYLIPFRAILFF